MTNTKAWIVLAIAVVLLLVTGYVFGKSPKAQSYGAVGTNAIENYIPAILYNGGYYSALPITTTGNVTAGGTLNVTTSNTATSTIIGGCFQFYATSTATALKFQASTTPGAMYSQYGACPNL